MRGLVPEVSVEQVAEACGVLRLLVQQVDAGELEASATERGALVGALAALEGVASVEEGVDPA